MGAVCENAHNQNEDMGERINLLEQSRISEECNKENPFVLLKISISGV